MDSADEPVSPAFDIAGFLNERPIVPVQWAILGLCFLVMMTDGFHTAAMAFVAPALMADLAISKLTLGPILAAALVGLALGAFAAGPLADRFGRKRILVVSVLICSVGSILTTGAWNASTLMACRFLTGLGIGAAMPNCTTLASEFIPARRRDLVLNLMFCGFPLGASSSGFLTAWVVPHYGWRGVFLAGGVFPILLAVFLSRMPESISFMVVRRYPAQKIKTALLRIAGSDTQACGTSLAANEFGILEQLVARTKAPWQVILSRDYLPGTLMLWLSYFMGLVLYYLVTSWMPILVRETGYSIGKAATASALFPLGGGVGALLCGWLMGRMNPTRVVSGAYLLTALLLLVLARSTGTFGALITATLFAGIAMNGAQSSMPALAAASYPTFGRASGVAWMLATGRIGGIIGAFGGGVLLNAGYSLRQIISSLSLVALVSALALAGKDLANRRRATRTVIHAEFPVRSSIE
jgi:AAHS family 4-hydroxybenzoate transporter-like MFS transporter